MTRQAWLWMALPLGLTAVPAIAQDTPMPPPKASAASAQRIVDFTADIVSYDAPADIVTAEGNVQMTTDGQRLRADRLVWTRKTGRVRATGNVEVVDPSGDTVQSDSVELTDTLRDGAVDNLLLVLADGGRLAARQATRADGVTTLRDAVFSPCPVIDADGCPRTPSWQIEAARIVHDPAGRNLTFRNARLRLFGIALPAIPVFRQGLGDEGGSGLLLFDAQYTSNNGFALSIPYYFAISPQRDLTVTTHLFTEALPMIEGTYRAATRAGAYRVTGYGTYSSRIPVTGNRTAQRDFRGYLDAVGRFAIAPDWTIDLSVRRTTDRTFLRRYDLPYDDRLRSVAEVQRIRPDSMLTGAVWAIQTLRAQDDQGQQPIAAPVLDYRHAVRGIAGGNAMIHLNALSLVRSAGQDTQRAFASVEWTRRALTPLGQELLFTAFARGDAYHTDETLRTATAIYRGAEGFQARAIGAVAAEMRWPLIGPLGGGTQRLTPRVQFVASPTTPNLRLPNEDARSVDLEDTNLFALNRFPGHDRWEDGPRVTVGVDWSLLRPGLQVDATVGQSYRFTNRATILPSGTGLNDRVSDFVGRTDVRYRRFVRLTHRYRLDKRTLAVRRNEIDATVGTDATYATLGYLRLNRNIQTVEDLRDREEVRLGGRVQVTRFISVFGSATVDLTDRVEDPTTTADGYQPVRHRLGIAYTDECLDLGLTWRRDYDNSGDARAGSSFLLRLAFRGLSR